MLVRVGASQRDKAVEGTAPPYESGVYSTHYYPVFVNEVQCMQFYTVRNYATFDKIIQEFKEMLLEDESFVQKAGVKKNSIDELPEGSKFYEMLSELYFKKPNRLVDDTDFIDAPLNGQFLMSVDAVYGSKEDALLLVFGYYIHSGEDLNVIDDYQVFSEINWSKSTDEVIIFDDGMKLFQNYHPQDPEESYDPESDDKQAICLVLNVTTCDISPDEITFRSIGFSYLPLMLNQLSCVNGYFQLPIFKEPLEYSFFEPFTQNEPWGLYEQMIFNKDKFPRQESSLLIRICPFDLEGWLKPQFNFEMLNTMFMNSPSHMQEAPSPLTRQQFQQTIKDSNQLRKVFDEMDYDKEEIVHHGRHFLSRIREKYLEELKNNGKKPPTKGLPGKGSSGE